MRTPPPPLFMLTPGIGLGLRPPKLRKERRGWYRLGDLHLVVTERLGDDKAIDWVAVRDRDQAHAIWHGGTPEGVVAAHNTLRDLARFCQSERL